MKWKSFFRLLETKIISIAISTVRIYCYFLAFKVHHLCLSLANNRNVIWKCKFKRTVHRYNNFEILRQKRLCLIVWEHEFAIRTVKKSCGWNFSVFRATHQFASVMSHIKDVCQANINDIVCMAISFLTVKRKTSWGGENHLKILFNQS